MLNSDKDKIKNFVESMCKVHEPILKWKKYDVEYYKNGEYYGMFYFYRDVKMTEGKVQVLFSEETKYDIDPLEEYTFYKKIKYFKYNRDRVLTQDIFILSDYECPGPVLERVYKKYPHLVFNKGIEKPKYPMQFYIDLHNFDMDAWKYALEFGITRGILTEYFMGKLSKNFKTY